MEEDLREILSAGLAAADPREAVLRSVRVEGNTVLVGDERLEADRVFVLAAGKAAGAMARAAEELFGERIAGGLVVTKDGHEGGLRRLEAIFAAHPEPDERGVDPQKALDDNDSYGALSAGNALLFTGPTGTNVNDVRVATIDKSR